MVPRSRYLRERIIAGLIGAAIVAAWFLIYDAALAQWLFEAIAWWTILAGNLLASAVMLGYFLRGHRVAWGQFLHAHE